MPAQEKDYYRRARNRLLALLFRHRVLGSVLAALVLGLFAASFLLDLADKTENRFFARTALELVEIAELDNDDFPILDIKLRNPGTEVAFLKRIEFEVLAVHRIPDTPAIAAGVPVSHQYNVMLDPYREDYSVPVSVSQEVPANGTDRIQLIIAADIMRHVSRLSREDVIRGAEFDLRITFFYNESDHVVADPLTLLVGCDIDFVDPPLFVGMSFEQRLAELDNPDPAIREDLARILGNLGNSAAVPSLVAHLGDESYAVRAECALSLGKLQALSALPLLESILVSDTEAILVKRYAAEGLGHMPSARATEYLLGAFEGSDPLVRGGIVNGLERQGYRDFSEFVPVLLTELKGEYAVIRSAVWFLGEFGDQRAIAPLEQLLATGDCSSLPCREVEEALRKLTAGRTSRTGT